VKPRIESLLRTIEHLGEATGVVAAIDHIRLGAKLAEHLNDGLASRVLDLLRHPNMHARRVALQAIRRAAFWSNRQVADAVVERLRDPEGWVRYDAARALATSNDNSYGTLMALRELAGAASHADEAHSDDDEAQARVQAAKALARLTAS